MTNADKIRQMNEDELVDLLVWGQVGYEFYPECDEDCEDFCGGCANTCPKERRERAIRKWLEEEH